MKVKSDQSKKNRPSIYGEVEFRLPTNMDDFLNVRNVFLSDLAEFLKIDREEIRIVDLKEGCVRVVIEIPNKKKEELKKILNSDSLPKELEDFVKKYGINRNKIRLSTLPEAPYINVLNELSRKGRTLTWLHLSDLHLRVSGKAKKWEQDVVTDDFINNLPKLLGEFQLDPDFVFITGDLAYSGEIKEYETVQTFLLKIDSRFEKDVQLYFVPGNHDVTWKKIVPDIEKGLKERLDNHNAVNEHLLDDNNEAERISGFLRLENFFNFTKSFSLPSQPTMNFKNYYFEKKIEHQGINLGIVGINSSWRSTDNADAKENLDKDNLIIGEPQVIESYKKIKDTHLSIALIHHPPFSRWFKDFDNEMQRIRIPNFDFLLQGHEHYVTAQFNKLLGPDKEYFHISTGALYKHPDYPNSFNLVRINLDDGKGIIFYWQYVKRAFWRKDVSLTSDGFQEFELPKKLHDRILNA